MVPKSSKLDSPPKLFRLLGDTTRLRILAVLNDSPLAVNDLQQVLDIPQSTVSRHLGVLRDAGILDNRRNGSEVWYSISSAFLEDEDFANVVWQSAEKLPNRRLDITRFKKVNQERQNRMNNFFDSVAGDYGAMAEPGGGSAALVSALMMALNKSTIVDVGCGEGEIALQLARAGHDVIAVDSSAAMIGALQNRSSELNTGNYSGSLNLQVGKAEELPLADMCADIVILSHILHHSIRPYLTIKEAVRVLKPGGRLIIIDLLQHEEEHVKRGLKDLWLGFAPEELQSWMTEAELTSFCDEVVDIENSLPLVVACGTRITTTGT